MKPKKISKNLHVSKETIVNLETAKGGALTDACQTFDLSNCETWEVVICKACDSNLNLCQGNKLN